MWRLLLGTMGVKSLVQGLNAAATAGFEPRTVWSEVRRRNRLATAPPLQTWWKIANRDHPKTTPCPNINFIFYLFINIWGIPPTCRVLVYPDRGGLQIMLMICTNKLCQCWWMWVSAKEKRDVESGTVRWVFLLYYVPVCMVSCQYLHFVCTRQSVCVCVCVCVSLTIHCSFTWFTYLLSFQFHDLIFHEVEGELLKRVNFVV